MTKMKRWVCPTCNRPGVTGDAKCKQCGKGFAVGTGTGRRRTAKFCSERCKNAWHYARQVASPRT